jgi:hypothetical protein
MFAFILLMDISNEHMGIFWYLYNNYRILSGEVSKSGKILHSLEKL